MTLAASTYAALSRALRPPSGDASAFATLGLPEPDSRDLESEHVALFGRAGRARISPYEGARGGGGLHEILADYARAGYAPDASFRDRWDHVCVDLALLAELTRSIEQASPGDGAAAEAEDVLRTLFRRRVQPWVPAFFDDLAEARGFPFHRALGIRASTFLRAEIARLGNNGGEQRETELPEEPVCTRCGQPVGFSLPKPNNPLPPWGLVCVRCRVRADLGRSGT